MSDIRLKQAQAGNVEVMTPKQVEQMDASTKKLLSESNRIDSMTPHEITSILAQIDQYRASYELLMRQATTEEAKAFYQNLLNEQQKLETEVYRSQMDVLAKLPEAQLRSLISTTVKNYADADFTKFRKGYIDETGHDFTQHGFSYNTKVQLWQSLIERFLFGVGLTPENIGDNAKKVADAVYDAVVNRDVPDSLSVTSSLGVSPLGFGAITGGFGY